LLVVITFLRPSFGQELRYGEIFLDSLENLKEIPPQQEMIDLINDAIPLILAEDDLSSYFVCLLYLSSLHYELNQHTLWGKYIKMAEELSKDTVNIPRENMGSMLNNLAVYQNSKGNYKQAISTYIRSIEEEKKNNNPFETSIIYDNINNSYRTLGDYKKASEYSQRSYDLKKTCQSNYFEKNPSLRHYQMGISLYNIGKAEQDMNNYEVAKNYYKKSLEQFNLYRPKKIDNKNRRLINIHHKLSEIFYIEQNQDEMLKHLNKSKSLQRKADYKIYKNLELFGNYYILKNQYDKAEKSMKKALEITKSKYKRNKEHPIPAHSLRLLGDLMLKQKKYEKALSYYHEGLQYIDIQLDNNILNNPNVKTIQATSQALELLIKKANTANQMYKNDKNTNALEVSYNSFITLARLLDEMRSSFLSEKSKFYIAESASPIYQEGMAILFDFFTETRSDEILNDILEYIEFNKSSILFESIQNKFKVITSSIPKEVLTKELELSTGLSYYQKAQSEEQLKKNDKNEENIASYEKILFTLNEEFTILRQEMKEKFPNYYNLKDYEGKTKTIENIKNILNDDQILLEYMVTKNEIYFIAISKTKASFHKSSSSEILPIINEFQQKISNKPTFEKKDDNHIALGQIIYNELVDIALQVHGNKKNLLIVPDNILNKVPFDCLYKENKQNRLYPIINEFEISYLYSIDQLDDLNSANVKNQRILCLAPTFANQQKSNDVNRNSENENLYELAYAQEELEFLSDNFKGKFLSGEDAISKAFLNDINKHGIIHLATHGSLNPQNPMLSKIHFYDKTLTNYELENLKVSPELVVLSACNTANGKIKEGEGVISLSRGFFEAGVKSLQSSLWSIDDYTSSGIMKSMYTYLKKGESKSNSLRLAKLKHLEESDKTRSHPYFWAAMIHIGDPSPIFKSSKNNLVFGISIAFAIILIGIGIKKILKKRS